MSAFFISYRRQDSGGHAGRLLDRLAARFGGDRVFMDVQDIAPGQNFADSIEQTLNRCTHVLAVVGPRWLETLRSRAEAGEDLVRHEIAVGLRRSLTVIPVLVGGARMPPSDQLPPELTAFGRCQAVEIRDDRFDDDTADLIEFLGGSAAAAAAPRRALMTAAVVGIVAVAAGGVYLLTGTPASPAPAPEPVSLTGEWVAEMQKPGQPLFRIRLRLAQTGQTLGGMVSYPTGDGPIVESQLLPDGAFTFATRHTPQFASEPATIRFQGQIVDGRLQLVSTDEGGMATGAATRAAAGP